MIDATSDRYTLDAIAEDFRARLLIQESARERRGGIPWY